MRVRGGNDALVARAGLAVLTADGSQLAFNFGQTIVAPDRVGAVREPPLLSVGSWQP